jgi:hypothetical protein
VLVLKVVGKHKLRFVIPENAAFELVIQVPELDAHLLGFN